MGPNLFTTAHLALPHTFSLATSAKIPEDLPQKHSVPVSGLNKCRQDSQRSNLATSFSRLRDDCSHSSHTTRFFVPSSWTFHCQLDNRRTDSLCIVDSHPWSVCELISHTDILHTLLSSGLTSSLLHTFCNTGENRTADEQQWFSVVLSLHLGVFFPQCRRWNSLGSIWKMPAK